MSITRRIVCIRTSVLVQLTSALGVTLCAAAAVSAQTPPSNEKIALEEIIVTATKRSEPLLDVPVAVSAITADQILTRGFTQYADYLNSLPGVHFNDTGAGTSQIRIRGLSGVEGGVPSTTATYFGETVTSLLTNQGGKPNPRLVDIERLEVLRGPQGTLFGANALAGVVRIIPASPDLQNYEANLGTRGFTTAHSDDVSYHVEGVFNAPLVQDRFALRFVGYKDATAGYIDNIFAGQAAADYSDLIDILFGQDPGTTPAGTLVTPAIPATTRHDINSEDVIGGRVAAAWQPSERLRFDVTYAVQDVTLDSENHTLPAAGLYEQSRGLDFFQQGKQVENLDMATLTARYDHEALSVVWVTSWMKFEQSHSDDFTTLSALALGVALPWAFVNEGTGKLFTQELRVQSSGEGALQWLAGAFYLHQEADFFQQIVDYSCPTCLSGFLFDQDFAIRSGGLTYKQNQRSIFGEVSYNLTPRWTAGVGGRYLEEDVFAGLPAVEGFLIDFGTGMRDAVGAPASISEFNPSAYLRFKPVEAMTLYAQAARGFRSGRPNNPLPDDCTEDAAAAGLGPLSEPDTLWNYELGMKSEFADRRLGLNAAVYHADWEGVQLSTDLECQFNGTINGGDATGEGAEVEVLARPSEAWQFNLAAAYNRAEFDRVQAGTGFVAGARLPDVAEQNVSAGAQYNFTLGGEWSGFARLDFIYVGDVSYHFAEEDILVGGYSTGNARIGFRRDNLSAELFGRNLSDKRGITNLGDLELGGNEDLIRPRELGIELRYSFR